MGKIPLNFCSELTLRLSWRIQRNEINFLPDISLRVYNNFIRLFVPLILFKRLKVFEHYFEIRLHSWHV